MANEVATTEPRSVLLDMSKRYGMEPKPFEEVVRVTCMQPDKNGRVPNQAEFAAFLLVAKEYKLNPLTKEIYAYAAKGGGIVPIVSIDGWVNLVNSHPAMDGMEFEEHTDVEGDLVAMTCRIWRKDRSKPIQVTERLSECIRATDPWKMKHRMLRHKSLIQCSRYAFGFSGIYDEDEGATIAGAIDVTPKKTPPKPPAIEHQEEAKVKTPPKPAGKPASERKPAEATKDEPKQEAQPDPSHDPQTGEIVDAEYETVDEQDPFGAGVVQDEGGTTDDGPTASDLLHALEEDLKVAKDTDEIDAIWQRHDILALLESMDGGSDFQVIAMGLKRTALRRVNP